MNIKKSLLNGRSFPILLKQLAIQVEDIRITDEDTILQRQQNEIFKENIHIEGRNAAGLINLFGTLHCNTLDQLAVFEMKSFERINDAS